MPPLPLEDNYVNTTFRFVSKDGEALLLEGIMVYRADCEWVDALPTPVEPTPPPPDDDDSGDDDSDTGTSDADTEVSSAKLGLPPDYKGNVGIGWIAVETAERTFNKDQNCTVEMSIFPEVVLNVPKDKSGASLRFIVQEKGDDDSSAQIDICL
ncbi:MAG: hypothetical protein D3909_09725 [Candidatus Electrothrix sp. ATG1]|nr:hypothetical protein [Candidatus Electrothrix sp. ATG1]